jgi:hypothetical protein
MKYGASPEISFKEIHKNKNDQKIITQRSHKILSYTETLHQTQVRYLKSKEKIKPNPDFLTVHVNLRTSYKFTKFCCICGTSPSNSNPIEAHHVHAIKKSGIEITGFTEIMRILNKKQITICRKCHINRHRGKYNGLKLSEFTDPILAEISLICYNK